MQPEALREAHEWLARAESDILIAERALEGRRLLPEHAVYHAHQAAEKSLKGFLTVRETPFPKTHNLEQLVLVAQAIDEDFASLAPLAEILNPYATRFRYPGGPLQPELGQAQQAIELARQVFDFVRARVPDPPA